MMVLTDKPEVGQTDTALFAEELAEIYTTPAPKGSHRAKKVNCILLIGCPSTIAGVNICTRNLSMNPT